MRANHDVSSQHSLLCLAISFFFLSKDFENILICVVTLKPLNMVGATCCNFKFCELFASDRRRNKISQFNLQYFPFTFSRKSFIIYDI